MTLPFQFFFHVLKAPKAGKCFVFKQVYLRELLSTLRFAFKRKPQTFSRVCYISEHDPLLYVKTEDI